MAYEAKAFSPELHALIPLSDQFLSHLALLVVGIYIYSSQGISTQDCLLGQSLCGVQRPLWYATFSSLYMYCASSLQLLNLLQWISIKYPTCKHVFNSGDLYGHTHAFTSKAWMDIWSFYFTALGIWINRWICATRLRFNMCDMLALFPMQMAFLI